MRRPIRTDNFYTQRGIDLGKISNFVQDSSRYADSYESMKARPQLTTIASFTHDGYGKESWIEEARKHITSSKILREVRRRRKTLYDHASSSRQQQQHVQVMQASVQSSNLLCGYALELVLKAGLTALYVGVLKEAV